jgi:hypothetical protein
VTIEMDILIELESMTVAKMTAFDYLYTSICTKIGK